ncbi:MAG: hypothetical protein Q9227_001434 [Pyrenula ochraceoflavens]
MQSSILSSQLSYFHKLIDIQFHADPDRQQGRSEILRFGLAASDLFDASHHKNRQCPFENLFDFLNQVLTALRRLLFILANGTHVKKYIRTQIRQRAEDPDPDLSALTILDKKFQALNGLSKELGDTYVRCEKMLEDWIPPKEEKEHNLIPSVSNSGNFQALDLLSQAAHVVSPLHSSVQGHSDALALSPVSEDTWMMNAMPDFDTYEAPTQASQSIASHFQHDHTGSSEVVSALEGTNLSETIQMPLDSSLTGPPVLMPLEHNHAAHLDLPSGMDLESFQGANTDESSTTSSAENTLERAMKSLAPRGKGQYPGFRARSVMSWQQGDFTTPQTVDFAEWPSTSPSASLTSRHPGSATSGLSIGSPALSINGNSEPSSNVNAVTTADSSAESISLILNPHVVVSFNKGDRFFKLRYSRLEVVRDYYGNLKHIEAFESHGSFVHHCELVLD